jgi:MarR family 2-MHQ and catechol resistance regulon transcriptional repressor
LLALKSRYSGCYRTGSLEPRTGLRPDNETRREAPVATPRAVTLWLALWKVDHEVRRIAEDDVARRGLCMTDFAVLEALHNRAPLSVSAIADRVLLTSGSMTTAVDRLEERGLVRRAVSEEDGRVRLIALTDEGRALIGPAYDSHAGAMESAFAGLSPAERTSLLRLLLKLRRGVRPAEARP